jgi:hypothetical protein
MRVVLALVAAVCPLAPVHAQGAGQLAPTGSKATKDPAKSALATVPTSSGGYLGGSDSCASAIPIVGPGTWPFDQTAATTGPEGQNEPLCSGSGGRAVDFDVWYAWTATGTGLATARTCNLTTTDTKMAVYPGGSCPADGTALACNDDTCGQQSEISWQTTAGSTYMIQIGTWPGAPGGAGMVEIVDTSGPVGTPFCDCETSGPCGNNGDPDSGCGNGSFPGGCTLTVSGLPVVGSDTLVLNVAQATPSQPGLFFQGDNAINGGNGVPFGDGLRCAGMNVVRLQVLSADSNGDAQTSVEISTSGGVSPGDTRYYQFWYRDPALSTCGFLFNLSNGYSINWI